MYCCRLSCLSSPTWATVILRGPSSSRRMQPISALVGIISDESRTTVSRQVWFLESYFFAIQGLKSYYPGCVTSSMMASDPPKPNPNEKVSPWVHL